MKLPNDLKNFHAEPDAFQIFSPEEALVLLAVVACGAYGLYLLRQLITWMFA